MIPIQPLTPNAPTRTTKTTRHQSLDIARGFAVLGMVYMHFVPTERQAISGFKGWYEQIASGIAHLIEGKAAALFCVLAGIAWAIQSSRAGDTRTYRHYVLRRALILGLAGWAFHYWIWSTEILVPLAFMMVVCFALRRARPRTLVGIIVLLLVAGPVLERLAPPGNFEDFQLPVPPSLPVHMWSVLRQLLIFGSYPPVPWLAFPLIGMWLVLTGLLFNRTEKVFWPAISSTALAHLYAWWASSISKFPGKAEALMAITWVPTSIPFMILNGSTAVVVIAGLSWCRSEVLSRLFSPMAQLGRASLTHYIMHICLLFVPMRRFFPEEDWSITIGVLAFVGYAVFALPASVWWFKKFERGPLEGLWCRLSGPSRHPVA